MDKKQNSSEVTQIFNKGLAVKLFDILEFSVYYNINSLKGYKHEAINNFYFYLDTKLSRN